MPKKRPNKERPTIETEIDELFGRTRTFLKQNGRFHESKMCVGSEWSNDRLRLLHNYVDKTVRVWLDGELIYAGPETDKYRSYIHLAGITKALDLIRRLMVLDDLSGL